VQIFRSSLKIMAKKTTKTDASSTGAEKDASPVKPARRAVAKLATSVKKKIKSVLEPEPQKRVEAKETTEPAALAQADGTPTAKRKAREGSVTTTAAPKKTSRSPAAGKRIAQGENGSAAGGGFTSDDIALRAYFLAQRRIENGEPGSPEGDWIEAERQLTAEHGQALLQS
jgi:hypothetical protein